MTMIFYPRGRIRSRRFLASAIIPHLFIAALGVGLVLVTLITGALDVLGRSSVQVLGRVWSFAISPPLLLHVLGILRLIPILTAFYMVLPGGGVDARVPEKPAHLLQVVMLLVDFHRDAVPQIVRLEHRIAGSTDHT